ncbi:MAG: protein kinase [Acidobacteria bacterium]|nr:protein kinase [Acidobacteriota bacterium]
MIDKMHCPKCGQNYPDGFQRFCDTDGTRLVPDTSNVRPTGGVFSSILSKPAVDNTRTFTDVPSFVINEGERPEPRLHLKDQQTAAMFFDEDPEIELGSDVFVIDDAPSSKPFGRRIDPHEIPAGHVDLGDRGQSTAHFNEFEIDDPNSFVGKTVKGRYLVTEMIGEDDSGFAYLGEDRIVGDKRVVIRILSNKGDIDEITESILAEERISLCHINHPNVARLFDSGSYPTGTIYLISEHIDGLTVDDILQIHGRFSPERAARVIKLAAYAVGDLHNERILHRDIHPENIAIAPSDTEIETVKVTNFGVSSGDLNPGNLAYQSPERLDGRIPTVASDSYSLAVVAYEMLTGQRPFDGATEKELRAAQRSGTTLATTIVGGLSPDIDAVFSKALSADPRARFVTAREFGDAFFAAATKPAPAAAEIPVVDAVIRVSEELPVVKPPSAEAKKDRAAVLADFPNYQEDGPAWTRRSPEPIAEPNSRWLRIAGILFAALLVLLAGAWYYLVNRPAQPDFQVTNTTAPGTITADTLSAVDTVVPPLERNIPQPPDTEYYANIKQNLKGDLIRNFVGFKLYYPKGWTVNGAMPSSSPTGRGKFFDVSRSTAEGRLREQMLISYYPSKGTFAEDTPGFPQLVKETNETLKKLIPGYQMLSEGEIKVNGDWQAYEIKFQGSGTSDTGERLLVWGRRLFIPAQRPGVRNGFEITMLATSYADEIHSVDDVGVKGELAQILYSFEPSQNF